MARQALGIAGAIVGAYFGGPAGAQAGFALGSMLGGAIDPETIPGPKLGDAPVQTSRDGVAIPVGWGICHCTGNIIQRTPFVITEEKEHQGKGGGAIIVTERRSLTFAIGIMRSIDGPIAGIRRIWEDDKLVYDTRAAPAIDPADTGQRGGLWTVGGQSLHRHRSRIECRSQPRFGETLGT